MTRGEGGGGGEGGEEKESRRIPSPTYQCTKARLAYMRSNLWSMRLNTSAIAVVLEIIARARCT